MPQRRRASAVCLALLLGALTAVQSTATTWRTYPVDDSLSHTEPPSAALRWRAPLPTPGTAPMLDAFLNVRIVLNLAPWVGKSARIYMIMPPVPQSSLSVEWVGSGTLQGGRLSGGQRQLVFQGVVAGQRLVDTLKLRASVDARDTAPLPPVNFRFEIEVPA